VEVSLGVTVLLCKTEINDIDLISTLSNAHQEVVRLDISVNEGFGVNVFDSANQLIGKKEDGFERELSVAEVEKIFQTGSKEIKDHGIVVTFGSEPSNKRDADTSGEGLVDAGFIFELRVFCLDAL
jgi:hypothetical protein